MIIDISHPAAALPPTPWALPTDDAWRSLLHNEVHARPSARIRLPALIIYVAVLNEGISREQELAHLCRLPGQSHLRAEDLQSNFLRLRFTNHTLKWERHSEFTRYAVVQALTPKAWPSEDPDLASTFVINGNWLQDIPGRTIAAIKLALVPQDIRDPQRAMSLAQSWFGGRTVVASMMGDGHSIAVTDFRLQPNGFERILVMAPNHTTETRAGRIVQRLLELETYRLMALRGLPVAKSLSPMLDESESMLAGITAQLEAKETSDQTLLDKLIHLAARVEHATADHGYRFAATTAYEAIVNQRIAELRERSIPGTQTICAFMQRRLTPAMATVAATEQRLDALSQRITRTSALLRTRVDIAREAQNQQLLAQLTRGQDLQLKLQTTVEGLSIAAISYYVISLLLYGCKALKSLGLPVHPELTVGALIPVVLLGVWKTTRHVHAKLHQSRPHPADHFPRQ